MKKYKLLKDDFIDTYDTSFYRIQATKDFKGVKKGDLGGYIESEKNLSQEEGAWVFGNAKVYGNAKVFENARVYENAQVFGNAKVSESISLSFGHTVVDVSNNNNLRILLLNSLNVVPNKDGKITLYKKVNKIDNKTFKSNYDMSFIYMIGKISKASKWDESMRSCAEGLHVSTPTYWNEGDSLIEVEVALEDIICVQQGKVRCKQLKVIREV